MGKIDETCGRERRSFGQRAILPGQESQGIMDAFWSAEERFA